VSVPIAPSAFVNLMFLNVFQAKWPVNAWPNDRVQFELDLL
jgi:hypothetical protein